MLEEEVHDKATHHVDTVEQVAMLEEEAHETATHHDDNSTTGSVFHYVLVYRFHVFDRVLEPQQSVDSFLLLLRDAANCRCGHELLSRVNPCLLPPPPFVNPLSLSNSVPTPASVYTLHPTFPYLPSTLPIHIPSNPLFNTRRTDLQSVYTLVSSLSETYDF